ncbi:hypothetical protein RDWZM_009302 [Blomia tropicalis]|uniref:SAYSvFN domain-containing protein n=1 Tax=Blomia tropicalis TaxID=40697 RepID=A0A9Q0M2V6_BLOTA|nr:hypothetical protein RDWZM_009302 [Blomia tropicalis]
MSDHDILGKKLSNKEKMEMFRSGVSQLTTENDVSNVRELLRQRYLKAKAEEELKEETECEVKTTNDEKSKFRDVNTSKMGRQLARVFRFGKSANNNVRQRHNAAQGRPEVDPFDDPNVLLENFGFDNDIDDNGRRFPFVPEHDQEHDDDDIEDDTFGSLLRSFFKNVTWKQLIWFTILLLIYIGGQVWAYKNSFGAVFFAMSLLIFICTNLRKKAPGELSAYSVFNPFCQHIPSTVGDGQPHDNIVLLGQL